MDKVLEYAAGQRAQLQRVPRPAVLARPRAADDLEEPVAPISITTRTSGNYGTDRGCLCRRRRSRGDPSTRGRGGRCLTSRASARRRLLLVYRRRAVPPSRKRSQASCGSADPRAITGQLPAAFSTVSSRRLLRVPRDDGNRRRPLMASTRRGRLAYREPQAASASSRPKYFAERRRILANWRLTLTAHRAFTRPPQSSRATSIPSRMLSETRAADLQVRSARPSSRRLTSCCVSSGTLPDRRTILGTWWLYGPRGWRR